MSAQIAIRLHRVVVVAAVDVVAAAVDSGVGAAEEYHERESGVQGHPHLLQESP